jgi:hypothetical protein
VTPFITAISISDGIRAQSLVSVNEGGDLYLTFDEFGRNTSVPLKYLEGIRHIFGVKKAVPRIIGRAYFQNKLAVIVGISEKDVPDSVSCISGRMFENPDEVVVGNELARHFQLECSPQTQAFGVLPYSLCLSKMQGNCSEGLTSPRTYKYTASPGTMRR